MMDEMYTYRSFVMILSVSSSNLSSISLISYDTSGTDFICSLILSSFSKDAEDVITEVENKLSGIVSEDQKRFFAIKLLEKDDKIKEQMKSVPDVSYEIKEMYT